METRPPESRGPSVETVEKFTCCTGDCECNRTSMTGCLMQVYLVCMVNYTVISFLKMHLLHRIVLD